MRILHLASFTGNIGDNASHVGFYNMLNSYFQNQVDFKKVEIRRFYQSYNRADKQSFDDRFAEVANSHDALVIGGGGFLDYWIKGSKTGTTLDISLETLEKIKVPVVIGSIGSLPHQEVPEENFKKFENFLKYAKERSDLNILLRNDGSKANLEHTFGKGLTEYIPQILDHAFFYEPNDKTSFAEQQPPYILINTTVDQLKMINVKNQLTECEFEKHMREVVNYIIDYTDYQVVFVPHIYKDINGFMRILSGLDDFYLRSRIQIAPYIQGDIGAEILFNLYQHSVMNIGMRFHANVCSLAFNRPTIGLAAIPRVENMHQHIGSSDYVHLDGQLAKNIISSFDHSSIVPEIRANIESYKKFTTEKYCSALDLIPRS